MTVLSKDIVISLWIIPTRDREAAMQNINITRNAVAIVSDEDYPHLSKFSWALNPQGVGYAVRKGRKYLCEPRTVQMHREIMRACKGQQVDHINGNGLDNRRENLRFADTQKNAFNRDKPKVLATSQYKGVLRRKGKITWEARIKYNNKAIHLGTFRTEEEGAAAYNFAAQLMFGDFARLNFRINDPPIDIKQTIYEKCSEMVHRYNWRSETGAFLLPQGKPHN